MTTDLFSLAGRTALITACSAADAGLICFSRA